MLILVIMVIYVTMVYGPIAAFLVELFPTRIRYTSMSLPYHIGNGWFGGMLPLLATAMVAATGDIYSGLWYPIVVAVMTLVIGAGLPARYQGRRHHDRVPAWPFRRPDRRDRIEAGRLAAALLHFSPGRRCSRAGSRRRARSPECAAASGSARSCGAACAPECADSASCACARAPHFLQQDVVRHDVSGMLRQHLQQAIFLRRQDDPRAVAKDRARRKIDREVAKP